MFVKYSDIENSYNFRIESFDNVDFATMDFIIQDKIDGSNISFIFNEHGHVKLASRSQYLGDIENVNFMGIQGALDKLATFIDTFADIAKRTSTEYQFYGEVFGANIQKRCYYGPHVQVLFFDLRVNGNYVSQKEFYNIMEDTGCKHLIVPDFGIVNGLQAALDFNVDFTDPIACDKQFFSGNPENKAEGVVIKPWNSVVFDRCGHRFALKKKSEKFSERIKAKTGPKIKPGLTPEQAAFQSSFLEYINENRVLSYFSKVGRIENVKQLSDYIHPILNDAASDFCKDKGITELGKAEKTLCYGPGAPAVVALLKKALAGGF